MLLSADDSQGSEKLKENRISVRYTTLYNSIIQHSIQSDDEISEEKGEKKKSIVYDTLPYLNDNLIGNASEVSKNKNKLSQRFSNQVENQHRTVSRDDEGKMSGLHLNKDLAPADNINQRMSKRNIANKISQVQ